MSYESHYPHMTVDEAIEFIGGEEGRRQVDAENARRRAEYEAWQAETIFEHMGEPLKGGPLVVGEWYDVLPGGGYVPGRWWRMARYLGQRRERGYSGTVRQHYAFERWGAKAATDPYARPRVEGVGVSARFFEVARVTPGPELLAKVAAFDKASR